MAVYKYKYTVHLLVGSIGWVKVGQNEILKKGHRCKYLKIDYRVFQKMGKRPISLGIIKILKMYHLGCFIPDFL